MDAGSLSSKWNWAFCGVKSRSQRCLLELLLARKPTTVSTAEADMIILVDRESRFIQHNLLLPCQYFFIHVTLVGFLFHQECSSSRKGNINIYVSRSWALDKDTKSPGWAASDWGFFHLLAACVRFCWTGRLRGAPLHLTALFYHSHGGLFSHRGGVF